MTLSCLKSRCVRSLYKLSQLTTNLLLFVLFCVLPVSYDVPLSHLNKDYLLTYLLTYLITHLLICWLETHFTTC